MTEKRVAIVAGARTPFVKAGKAFASLGPLALARHAVGGLLERHRVDPEGIEALAFGVVVPEKGKPNLAREIVLESGLPARIEAQTVSSYCISGLRSTTIIADAIARGRIDCGIAGGAEWLSGADPSTFREPTTGLSEAALAMTDRGVGAALVLTGEHVSGILTERDVLRAVATGPVEGTHVAAWMTRDPETVDISEGTGQAAALMIHGGFRHLPVVDGGKPVGIVSIRDLMRVVVDDESPRGV